MGILLLQYCIFDQIFFAFCRKHVSVGKKMFYNSDVVGPIKQECVPPASVAVCGEWDLSARGCLPKGGLPRGCLPWGVHARGGVCPGGVSATHALPPVDRQTPVKILPCSKLRLRAVNIYLPGVVKVVNEK